MQELDPIAIKSECQDKWFGRIINKQIQYQCILTYNIEQQPSLQIYNPIVFILWPAEKN